MSDVVGKVAVSVWPDTRNFDKKLREELKNVKPVAATVEVDEDKLEKSVKAAAKKAKQALEGETLTLKVNYKDLASVQSAAKQLQDKLKDLAKTKIQIPLDQESIQKELNKALKLDNRAYDNTRAQMLHLFKGVGTISPDLDKQDLAQIQRDLTKTFERISRVKFELQDTNISKRARAGLEAELAGLEAKVSLSREGLADMGEEARKALERAGDNVNFAGLQQRVADALAGVGKINPDLDPRAIRKVEKDLAKGFARMDAIRLQLTGDLPDSERHALLEELRDIGSQFQVHISNLGDIGKEARSAMERAGDDINFANLETAVRDVFKKASASSTGISVDWNEDDLRKMRNTLEKNFERANDIELKLSQVDLSDRVRRGLEEELADIRMTVNQTALDLSLGKARAKIEKLTARQHVVRIRTLLDNAALKHTSSSLASALGVLSGGRIVGDIAGDFRTLFTNIDKTTVVVGALTGVLNVGAAALLSTSAAALSFADSLAGIAPAALAVPGILGGLAVGALATGLAFKDWKKVLPDIVSDLKEMQKSVSTSFWAKAKRPFEELGEKILPKFAKGLTATGAASGKFFANFARSINRTFGGNALARMFTSLNDSIDEFSKHTDGMADSIRILGEAGTRQLPGLARWFGKVSDSFASFLRDAEKTGDLDRWIEDGTEKLKDLGRVVLNAGKAFGALSRAAQNAVPGDALNSLADGLDNLQQKLNKGSVQQSLTDMFEAAHQSMENFVDEAGPGAARFVSAFSKTLQKTMPQLSGAVGDVVGNILDMLADPKVQKGYTDFTNGLSKGLRALGPGIDSLSSKIGPVLTLMGELAENIGKVASGALENLSPAIGDLAKALTPFVDDLGDTLVQLIEDLGPAFKQLSKELDKPETTKAIEDLGQALKDLGESLSPALKAGLPWLVKGLGALARIDLESTAASLKVFSDAMDSFNKLFEDDQQSNMDNWTTKAVAFADAMAAVTTILVGGPLLPVMGKLKDAVRDLGLKLGEVDFSSLGPKIALALSGLPGIVVGVFTKIWPRVSVAVSQGVERTVGFFRALPGRVMGALGNLGGRISGFFQSAWARATGATSAGVNRVVAFVSALPGRIVGYLASLPGRIGGVFTSAWNRAVAAVRGGTSRVISLVSGLTGRIVRYFQALPGKLAASGAAMIGSFAAGIRGKIGDAVSAAGEAVSRVRDFFPFSPAKRGPFSGKGYTTHSGMALLQGFAQGIRRGAKYPAAALRKALAGLPKYLGKVNFGKATEKALNGMRTNMLKSLAKWDTVTTKIRETMGSIRDAAKQYAEQVRDAVNALGDPTKIDLATGENLTFGKIVENYAKVIAKAKQFASVIKALRSKGLNESILQQLLDAGPEGGLDAAQRILDAGSKGIKEINGLAAQLDKNAKSLGGSAYGSMYESGLQAAEGLLAGLKKQQKKIEAQLRKMGKEMAKAIKKALGIRSPSRVFKEIGAYVGKGFTLGVEGQTSNARRAIEALGGTTPQSGRLALAVNRAGLGQSISNQRTVNYYAAPNRSLSSSEELAAAARRAF